VRLTGETGKPKSKKKKIDSRDLKMILRPAGKRPSKKKALTRSKKEATGRI
jgi:hypothetical protein